MQRSTVRLWLLAGLALALGAPGRVLAQQREGFRLDRLSAPPTADDGFALALPDVLGHLRASAQLALRYGLDPLVVRTPSEHSVVRHRTAAEVVGAVGLFDVLELYLRVPAVLSSRGDDATFELARLAAPSGAALSDMALGVTVGGAVWRDLRLGARVEALLPTGSRRSLAGDGEVEPRGEVQAAWTASRLTFAGVLGGTYRVARDYASVHIGPELHWGGALRVRLEARVEAWLEVLGTRALRARSAAGASDGVEVLIGARKRLEGERLQTSVGGALGAGLTDLPGEPDFRMLFTVGVIRRNREPRAENAPALDRDQDGVADGADRCPNEVEDRDGFEDGDGCIDLDVDNDGVRDEDDTCPRVAGPSRTGCPTDDLDEDGVLDARDRCPRDAEDVDGDRDDDGCPDVDSDGDGLTDDRDSCPDVRGLAARQGCLEHARLERERIALLTPISFDTQNVQLSSASGPVLDDVAALLQSRPQLSALITVRLVRRPVPDGGEVTARAQAMLVVEALVARGVGRARLATAVELARAGVDRVELTVRALAP